MLTAETSVRRAVRCSSAIVSAPQLHHRRAHLGQRGLEAVLQWTGIGNIAIDALFERELVLLVAATDIVALPVACAVAALTPVLFDDRVVESELAAGRFVEAGRNSGPSLRSRHPSRARA